MITANQKKFVKSLAQKKFRIQHQCFVVEGVKLVDELLVSDFSIRSIYATSSWINDHPGVEAVPVTSKDLSIMSAFKSAHEVLAVVEFKSPKKPVTLQGVALALDFIQDPGNLGTIIRTADWFGMNTIYCSSDCVDLYNPKVIQATMGSIFRVQVLYGNLEELLPQHKGAAIYGALLNGENVYTQTLEKDHAILVMGNESKGISPKLMPFITHPVSIPGKGKAESLNVASATAILCAEFAK
ncbi:MAG: RNA methyltransferase [Flavobacteriales bacterium]|nr:RNA methyltransferase [Flavobacteriales bacterium]